MQICKLDSPIAYRKQMQPAIDGCVMTQRFGVAEVPSSQGWRTRLLHQNSFRRAFAFFAALLVLTTSPGVLAAERNYLTAEQRRADFAAFCAFVADEYAYLDQKATDWPRACGYYSGLAEHAENRDGFIHALEGGLAELYDHHAHLGTNTDASSRLVPSQTDVIATWRADKAFVVAVRQDSAAARAGLREGEEIISINGLAILQAVTAVAPRFVRPGDEAARRWALQVALAGRHDQPELRLRVRVGDKMIEHRFAPSFAAAASSLTWRSSENVGYMRINNALGDATLVPEFDKGLSAMRDTSALLIDLRDTPSGGNSTVARGILGRLVDKPLPYQRHELIAEFRKTGIRRLWVEYVAPREWTFRKPVVVLVGPWTGSMGEGLAIGLNATLNAPVVGRPMAHLLGALGELSLPNSHIVVRIPTERLFHVNGLPREAFLPCVLSPLVGSLHDDDPELSAALALAKAAGSARGERKPAANCAQEAGLAPIVRGSAASS